MIVRICFVNCILHGNEFVRTYIAPFVVISKFINILSNCCNSLVERICLRSEFVNLLGEFGKLVNFFLSNLCAVVEFSLGSVNESLEFVYERFQTFNIVVR